MSALVRFTNRVGVVPGTTTMQLGNYLSPYQDMIALSGPYDRPIRWDLVGIIGGGSLIVALGAAFLAAR